MSNRLRKFAETVNKHCQQGPNAGKPGPCPELRPKRHGMTIEERIGEHSRAAAEAMIDGDDNAWAKAAKRRAGLNGLRMFGKRPGGVPMQITEDMLEPEPPKPKRTKRKFADNLNRFCQEGKNKGKPGPCPDEETEAYGVDEPGAPAPRIAKRHAPLVRRMEKISDAIDSSPVSGKRSRLEKLRSRLRSRIESKLTFD